MSKKIKRESEKQLKKMEENKQKEVSELQALSEQVYEPDARVTMSGADFMQIHSYINKSYLNSIHPVKDIKSRTITGTTCTKPELEELDYLLLNIHRENVEAGVTIDKQEYINKYMNPNNQIQQSTDEVKDDELIVEDNKETTESESSESSLSVVE